MLNGFTISKLGTMMCGFQAFQNAVEIILPIYYSFSVKMELMTHMIHDLIFFAIDLGTTWTQEMVWCIMNNLDFKAAKESILEKRVPYFEYFVVIFNNVHKLEEIKST